MEYFIFLLGNRFIICGFFGLDLESIIIVLLVWEIKLLVKEIVFVIIVDKMLLGIWLMFWFSIFFMIGFRLIRRVFVVLVIFDDCIFCILMMWIFFNVVFVYFVLVIWWNF